MNLALIDWLIVAASLLLLIIPVLAAGKLMNGVADFLAAGRSAGRYIICVSSGLAGLGAITVVGNLEMNLQAGFAMSWWGMSMGIVVMVVLVSGWVTYRFRQTRCLTLPQFFEVRYSRRFRIFAGMLAFFSGLINFGIFPAVGARFFIYFCGLPQSFALFGLTISTFPVVMALLVGMALFFVLAGGQIAVIMADFVQGVFVNITFIALVLYLFFQFDWSVIAEALARAPEQQSMINPFKTNNMRDFNFGYFLIGVIGFVYNTMSWQGTQAYNASARSAHEAKMGGVLSSWRNIPQTMMMMFVPIVAFTVLNHENFADIRTAVEAIITGIDGEALQSQLKVPLVLTHILPRGMMGAFAAVMLAAFISTHDTYLHSWGSILVQDVIMPFRKKPFSKEMHLKLLRGAIIFVAVFIYFFSLLFQQNQYIFMFFAITGAIFVGGSGAVIIGGLYWSRGTSRGAWAALITGSGISISGIVIHQLKADFFINGQWFWLISMFAASAIYVVVSLLEGRLAFNMDKMLKRGAYAIADDQTQTREASRGWRLLGMGKEFSRGDKAIYIGNYLWTFSWIAIFVVGTYYGLRTDVSDASWMKFWEVYVVVQISAAVVVVIWFTIGGVSDMMAMFKRLKHMERDHNDHGFITPDEPTLSGDLDGKEQRIV